VFIEHECRAHAIEQTADTRALCNLRRAGPVDLHQLHPARIACVIHLVAALSGHGSGFGFDATVVQTLEPPFPGSYWRQSPTHRNGISGWLCP